MTNDTGKTLTGHLSPIGAWAFAIGTSVGWGSMFITGKTYLPIAGPLGTVLGLVIGALIMLVIAKNYHYMMVCYPDCGGAYVYSREVFGYDHGFLTGWFLALTYFAMLWANATSLPLFVRYFFGDTFKIGRLYTLFGNDVYFGEILLSFIAIVLAGLLCMSSKRLTDTVMILLAGLFSIGIVFVFVSAMTGRSTSMSPSFVPDSSAISQVLRITCISPWSFIGFENISHASEEFSFRRKKVFRVLTAVVISTTALYVFVTLLSTSAYPERFSSWFEYISVHSQLSGLEGLPAFYAAHHYLGDAGVYILMAALLALIVTSLIGNTTALSRLFFSVSKDRVLPKRFSVLNRHGVPANAIMLIVAISVVIPFVGRAAIEWIVDVTTICATLIYGFVSAAALKTAKFRNDRIEKKTGLIGLIIMLALAAYLLVPNLFTSGQMEKESYFILIVWSTLGLLLFRLVLRNDRPKRFGKSIVVWIVFFSLILFVSLVWMSRSTMEATEDGMSKIRSYYDGAGFVTESDSIIAEELATIRSMNAKRVAVVVSLFLVSLAVLVNNYLLMSKRAQSSEKELSLVRNVANTDPLTGVKSKHAYTEAERSIDQTISSGEAEPFAVAVCDVNGLKQINDTFGHKAGDKYLKDAAKTICDIFKHSPVYRIGGDEFAILLFGGDYDNREALCTAMAEQNVGVKLGEGVIIACGVSEFSEKDRTLSAVFERADALMYENKKMLKEARV